MSSLHQISKFYRSFSGTDTLAFIMLPGCSPVVLGSLTTISYSVFRNKKPVINIGRTNINGVTRGSRIFAGTMIFTLINQYWFREIQDGVSYLSGIDNLKVDEIPLFDIMIVSANEYGSAVSMFIYGIDFTDEAQTISVEDLFTENTFSFVARDISTFKAHNVLVGVSESSGASSYIDSDSTQHYYVMHSDTNWEDVAELERQYNQAKVDFYNATSNDLREKEWVREIYYSPSLQRKFMGGDVLTVQQLLASVNKLYKINDDELGTFTEYTANAVKAFQIENGLEPTGRVDKRTYLLLLDKANNINGENTSEKRAYCLNRNGAVIYPEPNSQISIIGLPRLVYSESIVYSEIVIGIGSNGKTEKYYKTEEGYISVSDMYTSEMYNSSIEYPVLLAGDYNVYVTVLQNLLRDIYPEFANYEIGHYDDVTVAYVKRFKKENNISKVDDKVTYETWIALRNNKKGSYQDFQDGFAISIEKEPGTYNIKSSDVASKINEFAVTMQADSSLPTKITATAFYGNNINSVKTSTINVKDSYNFNFGTFKDIFSYNPKYGNPIMVQYCIYPYNKEPYKWVFNYQEG